MNRLKKYICPNCSKNMHAFSLIRLVLFHRSICSECNARIVAIRKIKKIEFFHATTLLLIGFFSPIAFSHPPLFILFVILFSGGAVYDFCTSEIVAASKL